MKKSIFALLLQLYVIATFGQFKLSGVVLGNNEPLLGASVVLANSLYGVSTSVNGTFEFKNLKSGDYLLKISYVGFEAKEISVNLKSDQHISVELEPNVILTDEILISATLAKTKTPMAYNNVSGEEIARQNMGQDIPFLLLLTPSFVATSDAGAGIGYTNFRIRGTDMNRINVAVNGIPLNDAESHGTWFVDQPDLASSLENAQVQRGVGTSANGAAAFGATINLQTSTFNPKPYAEYKTAFGSFNTFKNTILAGTGLIGGKFTVDARLSKVSSDGFIDRASADLKSFYVSSGYYTEKSVLKAIVFSGYEKTYQAWNGVPSELLKTNRTYNSAGEYTDENGLVQYYDNQVDDYQQDHFQLHFSRSFNQNLSLNASAHYTRGKGFYENYKEDQNLIDYQIPPISIHSGHVLFPDLITQKWLDNDFYGLVYSLNYRKNKSDLVFGGGYSIYDGNHFGKVIWGQFLGNIKPDHEWYRSTGLKKDFNVYTKYNYQLTREMNLFADLQYRHIDYTIDGIDDDLRDISQKHLFNFFNPKFGVFYELQQNQQLYLSFAVANREPNRSNYVDADPAGKQPVHETLRDWEAGYNYKSPGLSFSANYYYMCYKNQLILTGEINDVGAPIMVNADKSFRTGVELQAAVKISPNLQWSGNSTFSINKIKDFVEYVDNWDTWGQESFELGNTDLAFSPNVIANSRFTCSPVNKLEFNLVSSYVGKQFIDNTSNNDRILDAWFVNNLNAEYSINTKFFEEIKLRLMINNLFNASYESNAWVYSYFYKGQRYKMDGYFPQAGRHFMLGIDFKF